MERLLQMFCDTYFRDSEKDIQIVSENGGIWSDYSIRAGRGWSCGAAKGRLSFRNRELAWNLPSPRRTCGGHTSARGDAQYLRTRPRGEQDRRENSDDRIFPDCPQRERQRCHKKTAEHKC